MSSIFINLKNLEIILDSHVVKRNNTEKSWVPFTQLLNCKYSISGVLGVVLANYQNWGGGVGTFNCMAKSDSSVGNLGTRCL